MAATQGEEPTGLGDLPEACISAILRCMHSAQDVLRASCVNSTFASAASSDEVWQALLPPGSQEAITQAQWDKPFPESARIQSQGARQQPAVQQILGHLNRGVQGARIPGGGRSIRGRPLLLVPNPFPAAVGNSSQTASSAESNHSNQPENGQQNEAQNGTRSGGNATSMEIPTGPPCSPKELFRRLSQGVLLGEAGLESYRVDVTSRGVERMFSVLGAHITWGTDTRYWQRAPGHGSLFGASMMLISVCWLEVRIVRRMILPPGDYTISWRLAVRQSGPWVHPAQFSVTTGDGALMTKSQSFAYGDFPVRPVDTHQWTELEVGVISVREPEGSGLVGGAERNGGVEVKLDCIIREIEGGHWKSGLDLDCLIVRPKKTPPGTGAGGLRSLTSKAPEPLAELADAAADIGSRVMRWLGRW